MSIWQQLGAFVATGSDLSEPQIERFAKAGGKWFVPVVYGDTASGPWNYDHLKDMKETADKHGVSVGGWFNCWGGSPEIDAEYISKIARDNLLPLVILDCEAAYQYPDGHTEKFPDLVLAVRGKLPALTALGVSTNNMNNSMIWNGRTLKPPMSMYDLGIRVLPQWYSWMYKDNFAYRPDVNMQWLKEHSHTDPNFRDANSASHRGLPLSYVHGTLETTGLESSDLADELKWLLSACAHGYTTGFSVYLLENMVEADFKLVEQYRGVLYK